LVLYARLSIRVELGEDGLRIVLHVLLQLCAVGVQVEVVHLANGNRGRCGRSRDRGGATLDELLGEVKRYDELEGDVGDLNSVVGCAREHRSVDDELLRADEVGCMEATACAPRRYGAAAPLGRPASAPPRLPP
jgi:hypothetical protein